MYEISESWPEKEKEIDFMERKEGKQNYFVLIDVFEQLKISNSQIPIIQLESKHLEVLRSGNFGHPDNIPTKRKMIIAIILILLV